MKYSGSTALGFPLLSASAPVAFSGPRTSVAGLVVQVASGDDWAARQDGGNREGGAWLGAAVAAGGAIEQRRGAPRARSRSLSPQHGVSQRAGDVQTDTPCDTDPLKWPLTAGFPE